MMAWHHRVDVDHRRGGRPP